MLWQVYHPLTCHNMVTSIVKVCKNFSPFNIKQSCSSLCHCDQSFKVQYESVWVRTFSLDICSNWDPILIAGSVCSTDRLQMRVHRSCRARTFYGVKLKMEPHRGLRTLLKPYLPTLLNLVILPISIEKSMKRSEVWNPQIQVFSPPPSRQSIYRKFSGR